ncbi:TonB-dependent receptor [Sphingomicrobium sp. XHP0239]|uniref:TonB-dependent receptor domain-containing protein n=1 Tax=Sphingomicrobium maritimum TaxID=3133972 RepID=UPI0031CCD7F9
MRRIAMFTTASAFALALSAAPAYAQDRGNPEDPNEDEEAVEGVEADGVTVNDPGDPEVIPQNTQEGQDEIVVTGSRVRRDTFSSISPLQVLETESARDVGDFDAVQVLQRAESAAGTQIDATFQGFVLNNGPGSQTLNLRGLGADRTLLLINGRRIAPAGVEGAPSSPSINLIPSSLVARYDLLLDGASSVYGSDAVAGVGNIILRNDIDGIELFASGSLNEQGSEEDYTVSAAFGDTFDRGYFGVGFEYARRGEILIGDRDFFAGCNTEYEVTQSGEIRTVRLSDNANTLADSNGEIGEVLTPCTIDAAVRRIIPSNLFFGSIYFDPNGGNTGIPGFSDAFDAFGNPVDRDGDGLLDVNFADVTRNGVQLNQQFQSPEDRYNGMAYGEYEFGGDANLAAFFEAGYSRADVKVSQSSSPQLFPYVPANNPFNPCNLANPNGVDCAAAQNAFDNLTGTRNELPTGRSFIVRPVVSVRGDRDNVESSIEQYRGVIGLRGDLPFIADDWTFEVSGVYSRSEGSAVRRGIRNDRLQLALGIDPTAPNAGGATPPLLAGGPCATSGFRNPDLVQPDLLQGCVPVNLFAESLYTTAVGDFATQAERDYLFGERDFDTTYEQKIASAYATGSIFDLPAGPVSIVLGGEFREDTLDSQPGAVASEGLFFGFFSDNGAQGSKYLIEGFGELDIPVFDSANFGDFDLNLSGRVTEEEFYGTAGTYSIKGGYAPIPELLLKASYGTSFRAPNLRENFLAGQSGFTGVFDPCSVPQAAFEPLNGGYQADEDTREPEVLENCRREGRDPTRVGIVPGGTNVVNTPSVEVSAGGSLELDPETSRSFTMGAAYGDTLGGFDINLGASYYSIVVEGSIIEPSAAFVVNSCFLRDDGQRSQFCDFIQFNTDANSNLLITDVFAGFQNVDTEKVRGVDINANFGYELPIGNDFLDLGLDLRGNHLLERSTIFLDDLGNANIDNATGDFGFARWTGRATGSVGYENLTFTWQTRWIGDTEQSEDAIDEFSDAFGRGPDGQPTGFIGQTCLGNGSGTNDPVTGEFVPDGIVEGTGVFCRDVGFADDYFVHTASLRYDYTDDVTLRLGVSNIFDTAPPLVDGNEILAISNTPIGNGYDLNGREYFGSINLRF